MSAGARVLEVVCSFRHPETGVELISEEKINKVLSSYKTITEFAYICHDRDTYTPEDEANNPAHKAGTLKPPHFHVVINCASNRMSAEKIGRWFGIPANYIQYKHGRGALLDSIEYLTHESEKEQAAGKYRYPDEAVISNFDWRSALNLRTYKKKSGDDLSAADRLHYDVLYHGKTIRQVRAEAPTTYMRDLGKFQRERNDYLSYQAPMPEFRTNIYVFGIGGSGKTATARALARCLCPGLAEEDTFFVAGGENVALERYDGQPVIIWDDYRASDFIRIFRGRANTFKIFDPRPLRFANNVKYSSTTMVNPYNIITAPEEYQIFLKELCGTYQQDGTVITSENAEQAYRRFPIGLHLFGSSIQIFMNDHIFRGGALKHISLYGSLMGSIPSIYQDFGSETSSESIAYQKALLTPVLDLVKKLEETKPVDLEEARARHSLNPLDLFWPGECPQTEINYLTTFEKEHDFYDL